MRHTLLGIAAAAALLAAGQAGAQQTTANPADKVPDKMPFDIPYGPPIGLDRAQGVIASAIGECKQHDWKVNVAVVDSGGNLVAFARMDGAQIASIAISQHKAHTAATYRRETKIFENGVNGGTPSMLSLDGVIASRGGIPLVEDGKLIGAVGASGATSTQDEVCAKAGAAVINK